MGEMTIKPQISKIKTWSITSYINIRHRLFFSSASASCVTVLLKNLFFLFKVVVWFASVAMFLSSSGTPIHQIYYDHESSPAFRVGAAGQTLPPPPSCGDGNCLNPETNKSYWLEDSCSPEVFNQVWQNLWTEFLIPICLLTRVNWSPKVPSKLW